MVTEVMEAAEMGFLRRMEMAALVSLPESGTAQSLSQDHAAAAADQQLTDSSVIHTVFALCAGLLVMMCYSVDRW